MMMLAFPRSAHLACSGVALAAALLARSAAAQTPPTDLPAVGQQPSQPAKAAPPLAPGAPFPGGPAPGVPGAPAPGVPARPGAPPGYVPPGLAWMSPSEVPPGYAPPPGYSPVYQVMQAPVVSDAYRIPPPPPRERRDKNLLVGGIVALVGGMGVLFTGAYFVSSSADRIDIYCDTPGFPCAHKTDVPRQAGGILMMSAGGLVAAAGVPMWIIGSQWVYKPDQKGEEKKAGALQPVLKMGLGSASLSFTF